MITYLVDGIADFTTTRIKADTRIRTITPVLLNRPASGIPEVHSVAADVCTCGKRTAESSNKTAINISPTTALLIKLESTFAKPRFPIFINVHKNNNVYKHSIYLMNIK